MNEKRIVYMGTTEFSAHILEQLIINKYNVVALVSQPDRPVGRKKELKPTSTKVVALKYDVDVYAFNNINDNVDLIKELQPDLIITCAYGQKVCVDILEIPQYKSINVHASILPKYRGGAPIQHAIMNGDKYTGNTIMYMEEGLDTGAMLKSSKVEILESDTMSSLANKLMLDGATLLLSILDDLFLDKLSAIKQDDSLASYASIITSKMEFISFNRDVKVVYDHIRALIEIPVGHAYIDQKKIKFYRVEYERKDSVVNEITTSSDYFEIGTINGVIKVYEFQLEGKKRVEYKSYKNGNKLELIEGKFINEGVE